MAKGKAPGPKKSGKGRFSAGKLVVALGISAALAIVCALIGYMAIIYNGQKIYEANKDKMEMMEASIIYDSDGKEVAVLARENRELAAKDEIPKKVSNAFIATEDRRFQEHAGVDLWAIGRAIVKDIVSRSAAEGGSTITQQLAKNMFLSSEKTFFRKGTEMSIALALENNLGKDEILALYLNRIYFGNGAYGIKAASKVYFGKSDLSKLDVWEIATLAGIPKAPSTYNPLSNQEKSTERRNVVLKLMFDQGYITEEEKANGQAMEYTPPAGKKEAFAVFTDYVVKEAEETYKLEEEVIRRGGYKIYTTLNVEAQKIMGQAFENPKLFQKDGPEQKMQGSMVIVDNKDGGIIAMSGGRDYVNKGLNRASSVQRQPGSSFKPLIAYAPAIEFIGLNPYSTLKDEQKDYNGYSPRNYDGVYRGEVDMFEAVRKSINAPAVYLLNEIGVPKARDFVKNMGITLEKEDGNLAIALGGLTKGVTPLQMAQAYSAFPNNGNMYTAHAIRKIEANDGKVTEAKIVKKKVMSPKTAYYMTELLKSVVDSGTGTAAKMNRPVAGKTGTTQLTLKGLEKNNKDVWFVGYTPEWSAAVWMGFDKTDTKHYVLPASGPLPAAMFKEVMGKAMAKMKITSFVKPEGVPDLQEPPKAVTNLTAEYLKDSRKVFLKWSGEENNDIGAYQVYRKGSKEEEYKKVLDAVKGVFEVNDISVVPGETYEYYVVPVNTQSNMEGAKSNVVTVSIPSDNASPSPSASPEASGASVKPGASVTPGKSAKPGQSGQASPTPTPAGSAKVAQSPADSKVPASGTQPSPSAAAAGDVSASTGSSSSGNGTGTNNSGN